MRALDLHMYVDLGQRYVVEISHEHGHLRALGGLGDQVQVANEGVRARGLLCGRGGRRVAALRRRRGCRGRWELAVGHGGRGDRGVHCVYDVLFFVFVWVSVGAGVFTLLLFYVRRGR